MDCLKNRERNRESAKKMEREMDAGAGLPAKDPQAEKEARLPLSVTATSLACTHALSVVAHRGYGAVWREYAVSPLNRRI